MDSNSGTLIIPILWGRDGIPWGCPVCSCTFLCAGFGGLTGLEGDLLVIGEKRLWLGEYRSVVIQEQGCRDAGEGAWARAGG